MLLQKNPEKPIELGRLYIPLFTRVFCIQLRWWIAGCLNHQQYGSTPVTTGTPVRVKLTACSLYLYRKLYNPIGSNWKFGDLSCSRHRWCQWWLGWVCLHPNHPNQAASNSIILLMEELLHQLIW